MITDEFLSRPCRLAVLNAEARAVARTCASYGVLTRSQLVELSGARRWARGEFSYVLAHAVENGLVRDLGFGFYAPPRNNDSNSMPAGPNASHG